MMFFQICLCICLAFFLQGVHPAPNSSQIVTNIVEGFYAQPGQFPYQVSLVEPKRPYHFCGGSILDNYHILTAAHCCATMTNSEYYIVAGTNDLSSNEKTKIPVQSVTLHEQFNPETLINDICIVRLSVPLNFNNYIQPITITQKSVEAETPCTISGWGQWSQEDSTVHSQLKFTYIPFIDSYICMQYPGKTIRFDPRTMVCAGTRREDTGACNRDSGGPLVCNNRLVGVTSFVAIPCGRTVYPDFFTKVSSYISWLQYNGVRLAVD